MMVMVPVTFESTEKALSLIPNEKTITVSPTHTLRAPTPEELESLRQQGVDIEKLPPKLLFSGDGKK